MFSTWLLQNWWLLNGTLPNPPFLDQAVCMHQWNPQLLMVKSAKTTFLLFKFKSSMVLDTTNPPQVFSVPPWYQSSFLRGVLQLLMVRSMAKEGVAGSARVLSNQLMFTFRKHRAGGCSQWFDQNCWCWWWWWLLLQLLLLVPALLLVLLLLLLLLLLFLRVFLLLLLILLPLLLYVTIISIITSILSSTKTRNVIP